MALLLYPSEDGKIQSILQDLWIRVDDRQKTALSLHTAFMQEVAKLETRFLEMVFGKNLFSVRSLGASLYYSAASITLMALLFSYLEGVHAKTLLFEWCLLIVFAFAGASPILFPSRRFIAAWFCFIVLLVFAASIWFPSLPSYDVPFTAMKYLEMVLVILMSFMIGVGSDLLFIVTTRYALLWASGMRSFIKLLAVIILDCFLAMCICVLPFIVGIFTPINIMFSMTLPPSPQEVPLIQSWPAIIALILVSASNVLDAIVALCFVFLAVLLLAHRAFWEPLNRTIFRIQEIGFKGRCALLYCIGLALLFGPSASSKMAEWVKMFTDALK
jgi:hypothetical protein